MVLEENKKNTRIRIIGDWTQKGVESQNLCLKLSRESCAITETSRDGSATHYFGLPYSVQTGTSTNMLRFYGAPLESFGNKQSFRYEIDFDDLVLTSSEDENFRMVFTRVWK